MARVGDDTAAFIVNGLNIPIVQELSRNISDDDSAGVALLERYVREEDERPASANICRVYERQSILPVVDVSLLLESPGEKEKLASACGQWGFFQAINHGIPLSVLEQMKKSAREFFHLPLQEKLKYRLQEGGPPEGYGQTFVFSEDQPLDWSDTLYFTAMPEDKRNLKSWPESPPEFRAIADRYSRETENLINLLMKVFAEDLGVKPATRLTDSEEERKITLRMNYYPPCPRPDQILGLSPHTDSTFISVLLQDDQTIGLEIRSQDAEWIPVNPIPGALVINIGDTLEVISNGRYRSVEHRALTNKDFHRLSIAAFYDPGVEEVIGPFPELVDEQHPLQYKTFKRSEYLRACFSSRLRGKKHSAKFIKLDNNLN